jgi:hypothetical protein
MFSWQKLLQQLEQLVTSLVRLVKARRREETALGLAAILFWLGSSLIGWFPEDLQNFIKSWHGQRIIPGVLYTAGAGFLIYAAYRIWRLVHTSELPPIANRPSAIKGPGAFTPADGKLFRKLGREDDLKSCSATSKTIKSA